MQGTAEITYTWQRILFLNFYKSIHCYFSKNQTYTNTLPAQLCNFSEQLNAVIIITIIEKMSREFQIEKLSSKSEGIIIRNLIVHIQIAYLMKHLKCVIKLTNPAK